MMMMMLGKAVENWECPQAVGPQGCPQVSTAQVVTSGSVPLSMAGWEMRASGTIKAH